MAPTKEEVVVMADDSSASAEGVKEDAVRDQSAKLASWVTVKRTKRMFGQGAYGMRGIIVLTDTKLVFLAGGQTEWEIDRANIANVKRPRWALGSYLTFEVNGAFYGVAFGGRGLPSTVSSSDLAIRYGGSVGAGAGILGDAVAVAAMVSTAKRCRQWFDLLSSNG
jgi:hypothetical protein